MMNARLHSVRVFRAFSFLLCAGIALFGPMTHSTASQVEVEQEQPPIAPPLALAARVPSDAVAMIAWVNGDPAVLATPMGMEMRQQVGQWLAGSRTASTWADLASRLNLTPDELTDIVLSRRALLVEAPRSPEEGPPRPSFSDMMPMLPPSIDHFDQATIAERYDRWVVGFEADAAFAERIVEAYRCRVFKFIDECPVYLGAEGALRLGICGDWIFLSGVKGEAMLQSLLAHAPVSPLLNAPEFLAAPQLGGEGFLAYFRRESHRFGGTSHRLALAMTAPHGVEVGLLTYDSRDQDQVAPVIPQGVSPALDALTPHGWFVSLEAMDFTARWTPGRRSLFFNPFMQLLGRLRTIADDLDPVMLTILGEPGFHTADAAVENQRPHWPSIGIALRVRQPLKVSKALDDYVLTLIEGWRMFASGGKDVEITPEIPDDPMGPRGADTSHMLPPWMTGPSSPQADDFGMFWGFVDAPAGGEVADPARWWVIANAKASFETMRKTLQRHGAVLGRATPSIAVEGRLNGRRWGESTMLWKSLPERENDWGFRQRMLSWGDFLHNLPLIHWTVRPVQGPAPGDDPAQTHYVSTHLQIQWEAADPAP